MQDTRAVFSIAPRKYHQLKISTETVYPVIEGIYPGGLKRRWLVFTRSCVVSEGVSRPSGDQI